MLGYLALICVVLCCRTSGSPADANTPSETPLFGDSPLPDGVDPSFLAALPDNIRQEVIAEQLRLQRIQQRAQQQRQEAEALGAAEVNPEFLAALPPNIQEEVSFHSYILTIF